MAKLTTATSNCPSREGLQPPGVAPAGVMTLVTPWGMPKARPAKAAMTAALNFILTASAWWLNWEIFCGASASRVRVLCVLKKKKEGEFVGVHAKG